MQEQAADFLLCLQSRVQGLSRGGSKSLVNIMSDIKGPYAQQATFTILQGSWTTIAYQMCPWSCLSMAYDASCPNLSQAQYVCYFLKLGVCIDFDVLFLEEPMPKSLQEPVICGSDKTVRLTCSLLETCRVRRGVPFSVFADSIDLINKSCPYRDLTVSAGRLVEFKKLKKYLYLLQVIHLRKKRDQRDGWKNEGGKSEPPEKEMRDEIH